MDLGRVGRLRELRIGVDPADAVCRCKEDATGVDRRPMNDTRRQCHPICRLAAAFRAQIDDIDPPGIRPATVDPGRVADRSVDGGHRDVIAPTAEEPGRQTLLVLLVDADAGKPVEPVVGQKVHVVVDVQVGGIPLVLVQLLLRHRWI